MKIEFEKIKETVIPEFYGGKKDMARRMYVDENNKIMKACLEPGASIGMHCHEKNSEIVYVLSGQGKMLYDDGEEVLNAGECHYCPMGHSHSLMNNGSDDLIFLAVVPEHMK